MTQTNRKTLDLPPRVMAVYAFGESPDDTRVMLMLSEGMGHHTETLDAADMQSWLSEHSPQSFFELEGKRVVDLASLPPEVLAPCLVHARAKQAERTPPSGLELGCLAEAHRDPYAQYALCAASIEKEPQS